MRCAPWAQTVTLRKLAKLAALAMAVRLVALVATPAYAQTDAQEEQLAGARKLFVEAVADEDANRYDTALEKFRRVAAVKETANVRYRIATCLEALGRRAEALAEYAAAVHLAESEKSGASADVAREAAARSAQLDRIVPHLTVVVPPTAPPDTEVRIDDQPVTPDALRNPIALDPGKHTITAEASGRVPYRTGVALPEGGSVTITLALEPPKPHPTTDAAAAADGAPATPDHSMESASHAPPLLAIGLVGLGAALTVGSIASFVARSSNLDTMNKDCASPPPPPPTDGSLKCPYSKSNEVNGARNAAQLEGPLGWGFAIGALAAAGAGTWLLLRSQPAAPRAGLVVSPVVSNTGGMFILSGPLPR
jgi:hypothetical protein